MRKCRNDTLCCRNAENIPGVISNDIKDNFNRFGIHTNMHKMQKATPVAAEIQKNIPGVMSNDIKDNFTRLGTHTQNA